MSEYLQISTTAASRDEAVAIGSSLVDKRLAACAQVSGPITSVYRWQGRIESSEEWLCTVKTRRQLFAEVEREISRIHSYDTPEILAVPIAQGSAKYLQWLTDETLDRTSG